MKIGEFLKDKILVILLNFLLFLMLTYILFVFNIKTIIIVFIFFSWFFPITSYMFLEFIRCKKYYNEIDGILQVLDKKYLLPELLQDANFIHGEKINLILREISRDMHENVKHYRDMQEDYREYIETWVHEIKTPIASTKLIIENNRNEVTNKIDFQMDKIEGFVEQVLYYSRSNDVSKDYIISEISLGDIVRNVVKRNYRDFIHKKIKLEIKDIDEVVCSDKKWIEFIINQITGNAIKYSRDKGAMINIYSVKKANLVMLTIEDNGIGIEDKDINRVFEKGFTGDNGRKFSKSTGMGLYLCKKLCLKLGLKIDIASNVNKGTKVTLIVPLLNTIKFE